MNNKKMIEIKQISQVLTLGHILLLATWCLSGLIGIQKEH